MNVPVPGFVLVGDALRKALGSLAIACPSCNAPAEHHCKTVGGHIAGFRHAARSRAFTAARDGGV